MSKIHSSIKINQTKANRLSEVFKGDEEALHWCRRMEQAKRHYAAKGQKVTPEQLRRRVTQKFNQERRGFPRKPLAPRAAAAAAQMQNWRGPPERLDET